MALFSLVLLAALFLKDDNLFAATVSDDTPNRSPADTCVQPNCSRMIRNTYPVMTPTRGRDAEPRLQGRVSREFEGMNPPNPRGLPLPYLYRWSLQAVMVASCREGSHPATERIGKVLLWTAECL